MGTRLHTMLQTPKKKTLHNQVLWIAGVMTSICVHHTANGALARGYDVHVVVDCCVDRTRARHNTVIALYKNYIWKKKTIRLSQFTHSSSLNTGRGQQRNVHRKRKTKKKIKHQYNRKYTKNIIQVSPALFKATTTIACTQTITCALSVKIQRTQYPPQRQSKHCNEQMD